MFTLGFNLNETIGILHRFWWWCVDYAEDGDLRKHNDGRIALAVGLNGEAGKAFVDAMVRSGWIDREPYFRVHDWWEYIGLFLQRKYGKKHPEKWQRIKELYASCTTSVQQLAQPNQPNQPNLKDSPVGQPLKQQSPYKVDLKAVDLAIGEPAKHKLYNHLIKVFDARGWPVVGEFPQKIFSEVAKIVKGYDPERIFPYFEKSLKKFINENSEWISGEAKKGIETHSNVSDLISGVLVGKEI